MKNLTLGINFDYGLLINDCSKFLQSKGKGPLISIKNGEESVQQI
jgi:hypothetical protein